MQIEEFVRRVGEEGERTVTRTVSTAPSDVLVNVAKRGGMSMTEFLSSPGRRSEQRELRYRHILRAPASQEALDAWHGRRPSHPLPVDLRALVMRINGIHLWADVETGYSYAGLAPIEEWELARVKMYGPTADRSLVDDRYVALSYHLDGAAFVVLDAELGTYFLMDSAGPDRTAPIANNYDELLHRLLRHRIPPQR